MVTGKVIERPTAITKLSETPRTGLKNWLIYAESGVGKTVFAGTAPNALFLTVEAAGTESAKEFGSQADEWVVDDWSTFEEAIKWLASGGAKLYEWILIDSLSEVEDSLWRFYLGDQALKSDRRNEFQAELQDYNIIWNRLKKKVDQINRLPVNILYTALPMQVDTVDPITDEDITMLMPALGSAKKGAKLSNKISAMMTLTGYLVVRTPSKEKGEEEDKKTEPFRRLMVAGNRRYIAKTRHHSLGRFVDRPDIAKMIETINRGKK